MRPLAVAAVIVLFAHAPALAVTRACTGNPAANVTDVLCAPPSGPCTGATVTVSANIELTTGCIFDLSNRDLVIERTIDAASVEDLFIDRARNITITERGKIRARGSKRNLTPGGFVTLESTTGAVEILGLIDVSGFIGGALDIRSFGNIHLARCAKIRGNALGHLDDGERQGDGAIVTISTVQGFGSVIIDGKIDLHGSPQGSGGALEIEATRDVELHGPIDVVGGVFEGEVIVDAGDDILLTNRIDAHSGGDGDGGQIAFEAGIDYEPGGSVGGALTIHSARIDARGGSRDQFGGRGGDVTLEASGPITIADDVVIRADAAAAGDGPGGFIDIDSDQGFGDSDDVLGPTDGDLTVGGILSARGGSRGGERGFVQMVAGRDLLTTATIDTSGPNDGGLVFLAGRDATIAGSVMARATDRDTAPASFVARAGQSMGAATGHLTIATDIDVHGGSTSNEVNPATFEACLLTVAEGVVIDGRAGPAGGVDLLLKSVQPMQLGAGSRYLAGAGGSNTTQHPPGADPNIGTGAVFDPARVDDPTAFSLPACP